MILIISIISYLISVPANLNNFYGIVFSYYLENWWTLTIVFGEATYLLKPFLYLVFNTNFWKALRTMDEKMAINTDEDTVNENNAEGQMQVLV